MMDTPYTVESLTNSILAYTHYIALRFPDWNPIEVRQMARLVMEIQSAAGKHPDARQHMDPKLYAEAVALNKDNEPKRRVVENLPRTLADAVVAAIDDVSPMETE